MGLQDTGTGRFRYQYEKLTSIDEKTTRPRGRWVRSVNGKLKALRLSRSRKLTLRAFSLITMPSKIARIYRDITNRMNLDGICPAITFSSQWGLPVLSHSSVKCRSVVSLNRRWAGT
ncbi:hypothetical protein ACJRO7_030710 [Eucalyptus globulus]|uniref:Uncharacterized protein n=2 Tax=Eucalyptus TaxID=3932 RepID=A0ABD3JES0_EUCGL